MYTSAANMPNKFLFIVASMALVCLAPIGTTAGGQALQKPSATPVIKGVDLHAPSTLLEQICPVVLIFHGEITTARPTTVTYTWVDSRGRTWPEHRRRFSLAGVNGVAHKWRVGRRGKMVDEWVQLKVISPESRVSSRVPVHLTCAK